ncbi:MAG: SpoIIE family protein phosphatase [Gemmatimonadota bacterium]|nr:MAG: SpoIIE family protein phosphatase [Gemmatimonadota bacterium]
MADISNSQIRDQLLDRRSKLEDALVSYPKDSQLLRLLDEVDAAVARVNEGTFGLCEACKEAIEPERLIADPLVHFCLDHMSPDQQRALELDLKMASQIQNELLPKHGFQVAGWETAYYYEGAGPVSGDYCDLLSHGDDLYFTVGDVSGKGVAASMLMAHLHATFRTLVSLELPLDQVMQRASSMFCQSTLSSHFATLVCGKADSSGEVEICNAGHNPPLLIQGTSIEEIHATGLPLGMFCDEQFSANTLRLAPGDTLLLYTDGLSEAQNTSGVEYGTERLFECVRTHRSLAPENLISLCVADLETFRSGGPKTDDLTLMVIKRLSRNP